MLPSQGPTQQPMGLIPMYPFPPILQQRGVKNGGDEVQVQQPAMGFTFFPPIDPRGMQYGSTNPKRNTKVSTPQLKEICDGIVQEVVEDEILEVFMDLLTDGSVLSLSSSLIQDAKQKEDETRISQTLSLSNEISSEILNEVLLEELWTIAVEYFDDVIATHREKLTAITLMHEILESVINESVMEIGRECMEQHLHQDEVFLASESLIDEVIHEELKEIVTGVLNHYGSRFAIIQYNKISQEAAGEILDTICTEALMRQWMFPSDDEYEIGYSALEMREADLLLNQIILEVLTAQSIALYSCSPDTFPPATKCVPLDWFRKKFCLDVAEDVVLTELCNRLDNAMQTTSDKHFKDGVVELMMKLLSFQE